MDPNIEWNMPMGGFGSGLPTWEQYTGVPLALAFPHGTLRANGYYADFTYDSLAGLVSQPTDPVAPADPIRGGFYFNGSPSSTYLAAGPTNWTSPYTLASVQHSSGNAQPGPAPEPTTLSLCAVAGLLLSWRLRSRVAARRQTAAN
jgi:hypothetical protein